MNMVWYFSILKNTQKIPFTTESCLSLLQGNKLTDWGLIKVSLLFIRPIFNPAKIVMGQIRLFYSDG